ncbi:MAG: polyamine aminopropyltransferase [Microscillaceae bacterium]|nr:polyamine aminopropyltransferase [Microscillaceae bacterium]
MEKWFDETLDENLFNIGARTSIKIGKTLFKGESPFQSLEIVETARFGKMMLLDNCIMLTEANEFAYHEMIAHVPMFAHPNPERVLIIGGGDGGTAREVLKHPKVKECVMVEIDALVVEKSREFFPTIASELDNPRLTLLIEDGVKYIQNNTNAFDVILIDSTDPVGPAEGLFSAEFYRQTYAALKEDGLLSAQAESPYYFQKTQKELFAVLRDIFPYVSMYLSSIPFYPSGTWSFAFASKKYQEMSQPRLEDIQRMEGSLNYFNEKVFKACFALPNYIKKNIA